MTDVNFFASTPDSKPQATLSLAEALDAIRTGKYAAEVAQVQRILSAHGKEAYAAAKKHLPAYTFAGMFTPTRAKKHLQAHSGIIHADLDDLPDVQAVKIALSCDPYTLYCFISPSGNGLKAGIRVEPVVDDAAYKHAWQTVADYHSELYGVTWDSSGTDISRLCYVSHDPDLYYNPGALVFPVPKYSPPPRPQPAQRPPCPLSGARRQCYAEQALTNAVRLIDSSAPGNRHHARLRASELLGGYVAGGILAYDEAYSALEEAVSRNTQHCEQSMKTIIDGLVHGQATPITEAHMEADYQAWKGRQPPRHAGGTAGPPLGSNGASPQTATDEAEAEQLPLSDVSNAMALVKAYGADLRYCQPWNKWLTWRATHWSSDETGEPMRYAKATIKALVADARAWMDRTNAKMAAWALGRDLTGNPQQDDSQKALKTIQKEQAAATAFMVHCKKSLGDARLKAMLSQAQSEPAIPVLPAELDRDPWSLNCANGTIDLRTGELRAHNRSDYLTHSIPVTYDPQAACPTWEGFLARIMADNADVIHFLQRTIGYTLTGDVREQCLFIFWGSGANGKSTLLNTLLALFGAYGMKATAELLMVTRSDRHPTERADLFGVRYVAAIETEEGARLNEVFVKEATGSDPIRARRMREDFWQFDPTHKVILATNHKPTIRGTDHAIWRRIRLVPFTVTISDYAQDKELPTKLLQELSGILAWAVKGCLEWQRKGLGEPEAVKQATQDYRQEMDVLGEFLAECCVLKPYAQAKASELYRVYTQWCEQAGEHATTQQKFGKSFAERGMESYRNNGKWWRGIGLIARMGDNGTNGTNGTRKSDKT